MSDLKKNIMGKITNDEVKMRSRSFFLLLKAVFEIVLISLVVLLVYLLNIAIYIPQKRLMMGGPRMMPNRIGFMVTNVPVEHLLVSILLFSLIAWIIYRYTDLYKKHLLAFILGFLALVIFVSFLLAQTPLNRRLEQQRNFKGFYRERMFQGERIEMLPGTPSTLRESMLPRPDILPN